MRHIPYVTLFTHVRQSVSCTHPRKVDEPNRQQISYLFVFVLFVAWRREFPWKFAFRFISSDWKAFRLDFCVLFCFFNLFSESRQSTLFHLICTATHFPHSTAFRQYLVSLWHAIFSLLKILILSHKPLRMRVHPKLKNSNKTLRCGDCDSNAGCKGKDCTKDMSCIRFIPVTHAENPKHALSFSGRLYP